MNQHPDDGASLIAVECYSIAAVRLANITVSFFDGDAIVWMSAERLIIADVGKVDKEKIMAMERFLDLCPSKDIDHHFF